MTSDKKVVIFADHVDRLTKVDEVEQKYKLMGYDVIWRPFYCSLKEEYDHLKLISDLSRIWKANRVVFVVDDFVKAKEDSLVIDTLHCGTLLFGKEVEVVETERERVR